MKRLLVLLILLSAFAINSDAQWGREDAWGRDGDRRAFGRTAFTGNDKPPFSEYLTLDLNYQKECTVSAWNDQSVTECDFEQTEGAKQPTAVDPDEGVEFDGATEYYIDSDTELHSNAAGAGISVFAVINQDISAALESIIAKYTTVSDNREWMLETGSFRVSDDGKLAGTQSAAITNSTGWKCIAGMWVPGTKCKSYENGSLVSTAAAATNDIPDKTGNIVVGANNEGTGFYYDGHIKRILVYNKGFTTAAEYDQIFNYLNRKYAVW